MRLLFAKIAAALTAAAALAGCSLLKLHIDTGDPLPKEDVEARLMTRGFYYDLSDGIVRAADSIAAATPDPRIKMRTIRWKMQASRAAVSAAMQPIPEVSLADTWILCRRMDEAFAAAPDSLLFGAYSPLARAAAKRFAERVDTLARDVLAADRYALMSRFVGEYMAANPPAEAEVEPANTTLAWVRFLKANGVEHTYAAGSISEVLADMSDRVGGQTQQMTASLGWSKDLLELRLEQDSVRTQIGRQLDSLDRNFRRIVLVMEHIPQISDAVVGSLNEQVQSLIGTMNASVDHAFFNFDRQRDELQRYVSVERETLVRELHAAADDAIRTTLDGVPSLVGKVVGWLILLGTVVLGVPFALGFWLGSVRTRAKERRMRG